MSTRSARGRATCLALLLFVGALGACKHSATADSRKPLVAGDEIDAVDDGGRPMHFRIDAVSADPKDRDDDVSLYALSVLDPASGSWSRFCPPDAEGRSAAIPVHGSWNAQGEFHDDGKAITFGCTSGAVGKCIRFGYKPWRSMGGKSLLEHHLACVRMVRADYCGDGVSHTKDGTRIDVWDEVGVQHRDEITAEPELFEAAWSRDGAVYVAVPRWSDDVEELVRACPEKLRGRTAKDLTLSATEVSARFPEAKTFDARFVRAEDRMTPAR